MGPELGGCVTLAALKKRVAFWQAKLNLSHWHIEVKIVEKPEEHDDAAACVLRAASYDLAELQMAEETLRTHDAEELDIVICHELMHIHMRDLDEVSLFALERLPTKHQEGYHARLMHEQEGLVDRLARAFVCANT